MTTRVDGNYTYLICLSILNDYNVRSYRLHSCAATEIEFQNVSRLSSGMSQDIFNK